MKQFTHHTEKIEQLETYQLKEILVKTDLYQQTWKQQPRGWGESNKAELLKTELETGGRYGRMCNMYTPENINGINEYYNKTWNLPQNESERELLINTVKQKINGCVGMPHVKIAKTLIGKYT